MKIRVEDIPDTGMSLDLRLENQTLRSFMLQEDPLLLGLVHPAEVHLDIQKRATHTRVSGRIHATLQLSCHRCLATFERITDSPVDIYLVDQTSITALEELELKKEDLKYEFFDGETIDFDPLIAEQIFLSLPIQILCSEDCRGLCPVCGVNRNTATCSCTEKEQESPFAKLKQIKSNLPEKKKD